MVTDREADLRTRRAERIEREKRRRHAASRAYVHALEAEDAVLAAAQSTYAELATMWAAVAEAHREDPQ